MNDVVIKAENLSKQYRLGTINHGTLKRDVQSWWARRRGKEDPNSKIMPNQLSTSSGNNDRFWALRDVSFEIRRGDVVGIIGRNGAGKSTLLKILSKVTAPTHGIVCIKGQVASLLEVGTGFHPELTGRENVFLNGSIMGMGRAEIQRKFDEIVSFAEVEKFIDTPVKRYSSGMYVRLAFAIAAHLDPDILLVDEVLAVGDAQFQKKCLGKMQDVSTKEGRTVIFVSHNMSTITSLCNNCILLDTGQLLKNGNTSDVVLRYYSDGNASPAAFDCESRGESIGDNSASLLSGAIVDQNNRPCTEVDIRESVKIKMRFRVNKSGNYNYYPNYHFFSSDGAYAFVSGPKIIDTAQSGNYESECIIPGNFLNEGTYFVGLALSSLALGVKVHFYEKNALSFNVKDPIQDVPTRTDYAGPIPGVVRPLLKWNTRKLS